MKKYIFILLVVLIGNNFKSNAQPPNRGYVSGPEHVSVGNVYTYYTPAATGEEDSQYLWTLSSPYGWLFTDTATVSNQIDLVFDRPGTYYLLSNHGYDLQIFVTDNGIAIAIAIATPRFSTPNLDFNLIRQTKKGNSQLKATPFIALFKIGIKIPTDNFACIFSPPAILPNSKMWGDKASSV